MQDDGDEAKRTFRSKHQTVLIQTAAHWNGMASSITGTPGLQQSSISRCFHLSSHTFSPLCVSNMFLVTCSFLVSQLSCLLSLVSEVTFHILASVFRQFILVWNGNIITSISENIHLISCSFPIIDENKL
jgi:hypothetical protein